MSEFTAIGQYVTEAKKLLDDIKGGAIRTMQTQFDELLVTLNSTFNSRLASYQSQVSGVVKPTTQLIFDALAPRYVDYDPVNGDDNSVNGPFKTINGAIASVPNNGAVLVKLPYDDTDKEIALDEGLINIGNRQVTILGGYSGMEADGKKAVTLAPFTKHDTTYNRARYSTSFVGTTGGRIDFLYCKVKLPRQVAGAGIDHGPTGAFISGSISCSMHNHSISGDHIIVNEVGTTPPMRMFLSDARDNKKSMEEVSLSFVSIETDQLAPLIDLRYNGTFRFSVYSTSFKDKSGQSIQWGQLFTGVSYGTHGYATNLLAVESITKKVV